MYPHVWSTQSVKPQLFQSYNVSNLEKWLNFTTFVLGLASFGPFSARQNGEDAKRFCEEIGDGLMCFSFLNRSTAQVDLQSTACGMCPKNSYWSLQLGNG